MYGRFLRLETEACGLRPAGASAVLLTANSPATRLINVSRPFWRMQPARFGAAIVMEHSTSTQENLVRPKRTRTSTPFTLERPAACGPPALTACSAGKGGGGSGFGTTMANHGSRRWAS